MMNIKRTLLLTLTGMTSLFLAGCPEIIIDPQIVDPPVDPQVEYDAGFDDGFAEDVKYWEGYDDSFFTVDGSEILYSGSEIPIVESPPYDAGYYDGLWYAYNDGYFVSYDDAFTIGFSEGYTAAFASDWNSFLIGDVHVEWLDGGFSDGYNDGFSEGRIFGAWDYANGWAFDWFFAMTDYRSGVDLEMAGISTGENGPVILYEYGVDPHDFWSKNQSALRKNARTNNPSVRTMDDTKSEKMVVESRVIPEGVRQELNTNPQTSLRGNRGLNLDTTWLQRVEQYRNSL